MSILSEQYVEIIRFKFKFTDIDLVHDVIEASLQFK